MFARDGARSLVVAGFLILIFHSAPGGAGPVDAHGAEHVLSVGGG